MSDLQRMKRRKVLQVLNELSVDDEDGAIGLDALSITSGLDRKEARRIVRHLARKKLVEYARGYLITEKGKKRIQDDQQPE